MATTATATTGEEFGSRVVAGPGIGVGQVLEQGTKTQIEPTRKIAQYDTIIVKPRTYEADGSELVAAALEVSPATSQPSQNL